MNRVAKELLVAAVRAYNPALNALRSELIDDDILIVLAEKIPQSSDEELVYAVVSYRIGNLMMEPDMSFVGIPTLDRARVVYEEMMRAYF